VEPIVYERTQQGTAIVAIVLVVWAIEMFLAVAHPSPVYLAASAILTAIAFVFSTMTIAVSRDTVSWWFTFGLLRQRLRISAIERATTARVTLLNGLGVRTDGRNWLWIVNGPDVVTCTLRDGRRISLGTADAPQLAGLINELITSGA
jgi:hypothetical protein